MKAIATFSRLRQRAIPRQQALYAGLAIVGLWLLVACLAPWIAPFDPIAQDASSSLLPPGGAHLFGTDNFGRDVFSRVLWGARVDLQICLLGVLFPFMLGTALGALAGYSGGVVDALVMRVIDIVLAFPFLVLMLAIIAILGPGPRILFRHLLPNALTGAIVFSMSDCVLVLLNGAAVSYLGLGVQPPTAEWGVMVAEGQSFITTAWWITTFPGLAIVLLAMGFSLLADGLGDKLGGRG
ncbi:MAG: ABC transporter permease [Klebsiella michiganensis]|nr:ABC transporter permease [Klebsiella michiganensis]